MDPFDIVIAGAGLSGLSLACQLAHSPLADQSTLLVDVSIKEPSDRSWAFWSREAGCFDSAISHSWDQLRFAGRDFRSVINTAPYRYNFISGPDFHRQAMAELTQLPNIQLRQGHVSQIVDGSNFAKVFVDGQPIAARWVFDGRGSLNKQDHPWELNHTLKMHFLGWEIRSSGPAFDPSVATLMDFNTPQKDATRFFYVLPFAENRALVEFTSFCSQPLTRPECEGAVKAYLEQVLEISQYDIVRRESGCLTMTDRPFQRQLGRRVMAIGLRGGRLKPSTGYAFQRIQQDSAAIVSSLLASGHPFSVAADPWRYRISDSLLLEIMSDHGSQIEPIFNALFKNNSSGRIFRFLDQDAGPWEQARIIPTLPPGRFLKTIVGRGKRFMRHLSHGQSEKHIILGEI